MDTSKTNLYKLSDLRKADTKKVLKEVYKALEERGYNPTDQMVGYLLSGDLGYISNYKDARKKIKKIDRSKLLAYLLNEAMNK
ncbi:MAG: IreB family regulatory phosphoprotein [Bacilli bacterium]|nr:IreB family regulatory phosphoprotein [Bacilli bacterium]